MAKDKYYESEYHRLQKWQKFKLPNYYKKIGIGLFILAFLSLTVLKFLAIDIDILRPLLQKGLLVSLLLISISKDKIEDELTLKLRAQSYSIAFVVGVLYALVQPWVEFLLASLLNSEKVDYTDMGDFQLLIFMLLIQLGFFNLLKKVR